MKRLAAILGGAMLTLAALAYAGADPAWGDVDTTPTVPVATPTPAPTPAPAPVDINTASMDELDALPGIGPVLASRIIAARPFASVDELSRVSGIGGSTLAGLRGMVTVDPPAEPEPVWRHFEILHEGGRLEKISVREVSQ